MTMKWSLYLRPELVVDWLMGWFVACWAGGCERKFWCWVVVFVCCVFFCWVGCVMYWSVLCLIWPFARLVGWSVWLFDLCNC